MVQLKTIRRDKAEIAKLICEFLAIAEPDVSSGSTINSEVFDRIGFAISVDVASEINSYRKFQRIIGNFGETYDPVLDSSEHSPSGGGTISTHGWKKMARAMGAANFNFILNFAESEVGSKYRDELGVEYGFSDNVTGRVPLLEAGVGSRVVFYNTANSKLSPQKSFIGTAVISKLTQPNPGEYRLEFTKYRPFTTPVRKDSVQNVSWNNQHGMAEIDDAAYLGLFELGNQLNLNENDVANENDNLDEFEVDIRPDASSLRIYRGMTFTAHYALGEFIDNSITSALQNKDLLSAKFDGAYKLLVDINFDNNTNVLTVTDNAAGIAKRNIGAALKAGATQNVSKVGLGRYGVGMKAAAFWFGSRLELETYPIDEPTGWRVVLDIGGEEDVPPMTSVTAIPHRGAPGTILKVHNLWNTPKTTAQTLIRRYLPSIYRSYLGAHPSNADELVPTDIFFMGHKLVYTAPELLEKPFWASPDGPQPGAETKIWKQNVSIKLDSGPLIEGWIGILSKMSRDLSGLTLTYHGKVIAGAVPIGSSSDETANGSSQGRSYKPKLIFKQVGSKLDQSFVGEFNVSELGKTITTDDIRWTVEQEEDFAQKLYAAISSGEESLLRMASNVRRRQDSVADPGKTVDESDKDLEDRAKGTLPGNVQHGHDGEPEPVTPDNDVLSTDQDGRALEVSLTDDSGHTHLFKLVVLQSSKDKAPFFSITTVGDSHTIAVNAGHPVFSEILTTEKDVRRTIQSMALAMGVAEIFADTDDGSIIRRKLNYVMDTLGRLDNKLENS